MRHHLRRIVAVIEVVSPGNKDARGAFDDFVRKAEEFLRHGVHLLLVDLFPPTTRDPFGIHKAIWDYVVEEPYTFPEGKDPTLVSYECGEDLAANVEPVGVGNAMPAMPLFLASEKHVDVPLEETYVSAWQASPEDLRAAVETGVVPEEEGE